MSLFTDGRKKCNKNNVAAAVAVAVVRATKTPKNDLKTIEQPTKKQKQPPVLK